MKIKIMILRISTIIILLSLGVFNLVHAMTTEEVINYLSTNNCITGAYHVKPEENNIYHFTYLMRAKHWENQFPVIATDYNNFEITCTTDVGISSDQIKNKDKR